MTETETGKHVEVGRSGENPACATCGGRNMWLDETNPQHRADIYPYAVALIDQTSGQPVCRACLVEQGPAYPAHVAAMLDELQSAVHAYGPTRKPGKHMFHTHFAPEVRAAVERVLMGDGGDGDSNS